MAVEALFWFHPLVWWIEDRLIDERERACDEEVIKLGSKRHVYAESILRTCRFSVESPLACIAGVTGSDLKRRIEAIMSGHTPQPIEGWKTVLFAIVAFASIASPLGVGLIAVTPARAQSVESVASARFEVASVKPNRSTEDHTVLGRIEPGGRYTISNMPLRRIIRAAYAEGHAVEIDAYRVVGGPNWIDADRFDIAAKAEGNPSRDHRRAMLRNLLTDRFRLAVRQDTRDLPVYTLVKARPDGRLGSQLRPSVVDCDALLAGPPEANSADRMPPCGALQLAPGRLIASGLPIDVLAQELSPWVNRFVDNGTGLSGYFDVHLEWTPDQFPTGSPWVNRRLGDSGWPAIFTAVQEQLGPKLESTTGSVSVLVIDNVEQPTPD